MPDDYDRMISLASRFGDLSTDDIGHHFQDAIRDIIREEFDGKFGPDGHSWPPNKTTPWHFDPSNHIRNSFIVSYGHLEITVSSDHVAAGFQIYGTSRGIQPHPLCPENDLGPVWGPRLEQAYGDYFDDALNPDRSGRGKRVRRVGWSRKANS